MKDGYIQQIGTPKELYFKPVNMFVAGFIGDPQMNFIYGKVEGEKFIAKDGSVIELKGFNSKILENASKKEEVVIGFRPECCAVEKIKDAKQFESAMNVEVSEMLGDTLNIYGYLGKNHMVVRTNPFTKYTVGEDLKFYVNYDHVVFFDAKTEYIINED
jgi:multiple sugar transport system ATP-binding protein